MGGTILLIFVALVLRVSGAALRVDDRRVVVRSAGWILCTTGAWTAAAAAGAWFPVWPALVLGVVGALADFRLNRGVLWLTADIVVVTISGLLSIPPVHYGILTGTAVAAAGSGFAVDSLLVRSPKQVRTIAFMLPFVAYIAVSVLRPYSVARGVSMLRNTFLQNSLLQLGVVPTHSGDRIVLETGGVAWLDRPLGKGPFPGALFFHGANRYGSSQSSAIIVRRALLQAGFVVLSVDHPGYGESPIPRLDAPVDAWDPLPTMLAAVRRLRSISSVDKVFVLGHSMGTQDVFGLLGSNDEVKEDVVGAVVFGAALNDPPERDKYWYRRFHSDRGMRRRISPEVFLEIRRRFYDNGQRVQALSTEHVPILFVRFGSELPNLATTRDMLYAAIRGSKMSWTLPNSSHYFNSYGLAGLIVGDTQITRLLASRLRAFLRYVDSGIGPSNASKFQDGASAAVTRQEGAHSGPKRTRPNVPAGQRIRESSTFDVSKLTSTRTASGVGLAEVGTDNVYFTHNGKPLLSFGGGSDFIFYTARDAFDYKRWADWAADHGVNHNRAYPPLSWKHIERKTKANGGSLDNVLFPYHETSPGSRQFDLTEFDPAYWKRFRKQLRYLESKGIIVHLLMWNGWQLGDEEVDWPGHFFNPENNVNSFTKHLGERPSGFLSNWYILNGLLRPAASRFKIYHSVSAGKKDLLNTQKAWFRKLVEETHDLDNVYYDLVHEIAENHRDWSATKMWVEEMAKTVRNRWAELEPDKPIVLGMDTGGLPSSERDWIFTRPYFNVLIYGKKHTVLQATKWREQYKKPYIPQECWDDGGTKYSYRIPEHRVHMRKYFWKFMMAKVQQMDCYHRPRRRARNPPGFPLNYDPNGWNKFEDDALILRQFWNGLVDYPNLWFKGRILSRPVGHEHVLSSSQEAVVYLSSGTGWENINYSARTLKLLDLAMVDGFYSADVIKPAIGTIDTKRVSVSGGAVDIRLPSFTDDIAVHIYVR